MLRRYDKTRGKLFILASFYKLNASLFNNNTYSLSSVPQICFYLYWVLNVQTFLAVRNGTINHTTIE